MLELTACWLTDPALEGAMIAIQEASTEIAKVLDKLRRLESNNQEVVAALKDEQQSC